MGLDVHLAKFNDFSDSMRREAGYKAFKERAWDEIKGGRDYEELTTEEKDKITAMCKIKAKILKLDEYGCDIAGVESIEEDSEKYPKNYFKKGYFRSSYNSSGINNVLRDFIDEDLYTLFDKTHDSYYQAPDWELSKERIKTAIKMFKKRKRELGGLIGVIDTSIVTKLAPEVPQNSRQALEMFSKEKEDRKLDSSFDSYSSSKGEFYLGKQPLKVRGIIKGVKRHWLTRKLEPCTYIMYEKDYSSYLQSLEIMLETTEFVLSQPDSEKYYLGWSG